MPGVVQVDLVPAEDLDVRTMVFGKRGERVAHHTIRVTWSAETRSEQHIEGASAPGFGQSVSRILVRGREAVVEAAASLADEKGLEAVTLSGLASELGIRTPSLYNHVAGLEGLRRELALLGVRELGQRLSRAAAGKAADEGIFGLAQAYRGFVKERPGL